MSYGAAGSAPQHLVDAALAEVVAAGDEHARDLAMSGAVIDHYVLYRES